MNCPGCGRSNRRDASFCDRCGGPLTAALAAADARDPGAYTPRHLAEKILTQRSALEGERKQVTVLFVDIQSSMELAEEVDPEEWHRILDRFFAILADGIHRFEGTVSAASGVDLGTVLSDDFLMTWGRSLVTLRGAGTPVRLPGAAP
jgi:class 3 adenylate cyclase